MSHYVEAGNWFEVLSKNSKWSKQLSHLSTPSLWYFKLIYFHTLPNYSEMLEINSFENIMAVKGRSLVAPVRQQHWLEAPPFQTTILVLFAHQKLGNCSHRALFNMTWCSLGVSSPLFRLSQVLRTHGTQNTCRQDIQIHKIKINKCLKK